MGHPLNAKSKVAKVLSAIADSGNAGIRASELKELLGYKVSPSINIICNNHKFASHKTRTGPYTITAKGKTFLVSVGMLKEAPSSSKKSSVPKDPSSKVTNGHTKLTKPASMTASMFDELSREHTSSESRAEAIENLLHNWPR